VQGARILLVDPERDSRWELATALRRDGAEVAEAREGAEGLRFLARADFDVCLCQLGVPDLGGFGVFAALRFGREPQLERMRRIPFLLLCPQGGAADVAHALDAGVDDVVTVPCDAEELKARVRAALRRAKLVRGPTARTQGNLADFGMSALVQALHLSGRSARVQIHSGYVSALLDVHQGRIAHAHFDDVGVEHRGDEAAIRVLCLEDGVFELLPCPASGPRTVFEETETLLLRAATHHDESTGPFADEDGIGPRAADDEPQPRRGRSTIDY